MLGDLRLLVCLVLSTVYKDFTANIANQRLGCSHSVLAGLAYLSV